MIDLQALDAYTEAVIANILSGAPLPENPGGMVPDGDIGYSCKDRDIVGRALLDHRSRGGELVKRLKDGEGKLADEVTFWGHLLATMVSGFPGTFSLVTCPPSSGKREFYLAAALAQTVANDLGMEYCPLFINPTPRGHRATLHEKLRELIEYQYLRKADGTSIFVVDDTKFTGMTARRCLSAGAGDLLCFCFLYAW